MVPAFFMTTILRHVLPRPHRLHYNVPSIGQDPFAETIIFIIFTSSGHVSPSRNVVSSGLHIRIQPRPPDPTPVPCMPYAPMKPDPQPVSATASKPVSAPRTASGTGSGPASEAGFKRRFVPLPVNRIDTLPLYCISGCGTAHGTKRPEPGKSCRHSHSPDKQHGWSRKPPAWRGEHGHFRRRSFALRATAGPNAAGTYRTGRHICLRIAPQAAPPRSLRAADGYGVAARGARRSGPLEPRTVHLPAG